jgi:hypothetical protein
MNKTVKFFCALCLLTICYACGREQKTEKKIEQPEILIPEEERDKMVEKVDHHANGQLKAKGTMLNGKKMGLWTSWYENGVKWSETTFQNDLMDGETKTYYPNGMLRYSGRFTSNKKSGFWVFYDETGKEASKMDYDNPGVTDYNKQLRDTVPGKKKN